MGAIGNYFFPTNPVTERREFHLIPTSVESFVGESSYAPLIEKSGGEISDTHPNEKYQQYVKMVKQIGDNLATHAKRKKDIQFEFTVIDSDEDNAWCLPGGKIGINVGLIQRMDNESRLDMRDNFTLEEKIAAVLSHEIVHADARHTGRSLEFRLLLIGIIKAAQIFVVYQWVRRSYDAKLEQARRKDDHPLIRTLMAERDSQAQRVGALFNALSSWLISGISLCNSRSHELESDRYSMKMMWDISPKFSYLKQNSVQAAIWLQLYFQKHHSHDTHNHYLNRVMNFFSTHPSPEERLEANRRTWEDLRCERL